MADRNLEAYEAKLQDASPDVKSKALTELRDSLDSWCQGPAYAPFLQKFVPIFLQILSGSPVFTSTSPDQKIRQCVLEIIHRLPLGAADAGAVEPHAEKIVETCLGLVRVENEDNAVLCLKIVMDFCRHHTKIKAVAEKVQPFLELILEIFEGMEQTVKDTFDSTTPASGAGGAGTPNNTGTPGSPAAAAGGNEPGSEQQTTRQLTKGMHSFKVVAECPIIVVSIFQAYRHLSQTNVKHFGPKIKDTLLLQAGPQKRAHEEAESRGDIFTGVAKEIKVKNQGAAFGELVTAQVKTMSFLAYLLRAYQNTLSEFLPQLPELTVRLLRDVPRSHTATRKELLVAIRHIININFRSVFLPVILPLLDSRTLLGESLTADATLRPLAYTMLADLIHHVREQLSAEQISRVVSVYVSHLTGDDGVEVPGTSYQTMSAKLLLNMAECMSKVEDKKEARYLMMTVLNGIADRFSSMNRAYPNAAKVSRQATESGNALSLDALPENYLPDQESKPDWDETDIFSAMPVKTISPRDRATGPVNENKFLFKNLLHGLKTFFFQLRNSNPPKIKEEVDAQNAPVNWGELSYGFEPDEVEVLIKLFREGAQCFQYYAPLDATESESANEGTSQSLASSAANSREEKDLLETFATIFHHLDPSAFHEIFTSPTAIGHEGKMQTGMDFLYEQSFRHPALLHIPQFLLASEATSPAFCGMLLKFLMSKLDEIGESNPTKTNVLLRLFKLSFMAVTLFSQHNEAVLLPHVRELITRSIELSVSADEPTNYFLLLRSLFRSIGGGRFEHLYKEILPLLEMLLEVLNTQLAAASDNGTRDLFVELSLTVPARLSHLLPHLSYLMRPLTVALRSGERPETKTERFGASTPTELRTGGAGSGELTAQGLRTLELCVDNLTADYLDPIMAPMMEEIMGSLWRMLKPASLTSGPQPAGATGPIIATGHVGAHTAVRILGKLGGRNRRFITGPPDLEYKDYADDEASVDIRLIGAISNNGERALPVRLGVNTAIEKLWEPSPKGDRHKKSDDYYKRQAFKLVTSHVKLLIGFDTLPDDLARLVRLQADDLHDKKLDGTTDLFNLSDRLRSPEKRDAQQQTLLDLLKALMFAAGTCELLKEDAERFLQGVYRHFMLLELGTALAKERHKQCPFDVKNGDGPVYIETAVLADAIRYSLASDIEGVRDCAQKAILSCFRVAKAAFGGNAERAETLPFFHYLVERFVHACYEEEWFTKNSGAIGIRFIINSDNMKFSDAWVADHLLDFTRGLLYVIKDMPQDLPAGVRVQARDTILELTKRFGESGLAKKDELEEKEAKTHQLCNRLIAEVSHMNRHVRDVAQEALRTLAKSLDAPLHEIVGPIMEPLIQPIFNKPLRALPFAAQIGYIDAINFLLDMEHDVLTFGEELNRLLYETLALVDADDESLAQKPYEFRTHESIVRLRVAGLKLLTTAIRFPGFSSGATGPSGPGQSQASPSNQQPQQQTQPGQQSPPNTQSQTNTQPQASGQTQSNSQSQTPAPTQNSQGAQGTPTSQTAQGSQNQASQGGQHRARVISIFFKSLYSKNKDVATAANAGLKIALAATQKLPKDLLQNGLRPILMNVQDPRKLSVEGLEGLRTLLQLLTNYFKVEIGTRLLDHMRHIADPVTLQKMSFTLIEAQPKMKVVTAIFSVFHLLPPAAVSFLPELVDRVLGLETRLRRTRMSPFRSPVARYLNSFPTESWQFFSKAMSNDGKGRFFSQILADPECEALRNTVIKEMDAFVTIFGSPSDDTTEVDKAQIRINAICIVDSLCVFPETAKQFLDNEKARNAILEAAKALQKQLQEGTLPSAMRLPAVQSGSRIMRIMTTFLETRPDDLDCLFGILEACTAGEMYAGPSLFSYLYRKIITSEDVEFQRIITTRCIDLYTNKATTQKQKWFVFHNVLNPILANDVMRNWDTLFDNNKKGTALMDKAMAEAIHNKLWKPQSVADISDDGTQCIDHSRMELLQTSTFLIKYHHQMFQDSRKDLIKFGWHYIRLEDHINKYAAYVLITYFIAHYETPAKIAMQVYNTLLRAHQAEGKNLVMQGLEILQPVLKKRLGGPDGRQSMWNRFPKKILNDEIGNVQQLISVYQFLVRHPDLYYEARETYATSMITSISKVAQLPSPSIENRRLALNIFNLIWQWEERTVREQGSLNGAQSPTAETKETVQSGEKKGAVASAQVRLVLIKYMVQFIATLPERFPVSSSKGKDNAPQQTPSHPFGMEIITRSLDLLLKLLSAPYWDDLDIDSMFPKVTEQILCSEQKQDEKADIWTTRVVNTLQILKVLIQSRSDEWVVARIPQLQKLLGKPLRSDSVDVQDALHNEDFTEGVVPRTTPILRRVLDAIPPKQDEEELPDADSQNEDFGSYLNGIAGDVLNNGSHMAGINILWAMSRKKPDDIDAHIAVLLKTLQTKLAKDHLAAQIPPQAALAQGMQHQQSSPAEAENTTNLIIRVVEMLSARISALGDQRRPYLSVLASLVERSTSTALCEKILSQVENWVFNSTEPVPTLKEKTAVLQKMLLFEQRQDPTLYGKFMDLVIRIYEDPKILRSELAVRMEHAFLIGLRSPDIDMRARFVAIFDRALSRSISNRFFKLISEQQWDILGDSFWLIPIIQLMFGSVDQSTHLHLHADDFTCLQMSKMFNTYGSDSRLADIMVDDDLESIIVAEKQFMADVGSVRSRDLLGPLADLQHTDKHLAHDIWVAFFPICWSTLSRDDREDIEQGLVALLTKDFHQRQVDLRPNCVATLLEGIAKAKPTCKFPPHVMKYLAKSYDAWYVAATFMEDLAMKPVLDTSTVRESNLDALVEVYASLEEGDLFYGTWRRRAQFVETNAALSYEQNGIWDKAQHMYEQAQIKARTGSLPFSQGEYMLWEDQWVLCAQKLQQWEILAEFAKHENINDLYLEATWRNYDAWSNTDTREQLEQIIKAVSDAPTPRRMFFQAFMSLLKMHNKNESQQDFMRICDENIQLSIKNWHKLPRRITNAHIGLLQNFQQLVELHDASVICQSLAQTNQQNLDVKSQELKVLLSTWRDRLPNLWDDINAWQDLVTWRQHIFQLINNTYLGLLPQGNTANSGSSYAYRGYHETAWIINRFAHVARKHQMPDVCVTQLSKIYTLPNIEIQEAFLKLREQAKCHYQNRLELTSGLDVINNTNLNYFGQQQKAEFYTLKGMFLSKLNQKEEAHDAFGTALFFDIKLPKAWAEWGRYSDYLFKEEPTELSLAGSAISCYLEAAGQYKSAKSRKLLSRILWLLSLDNAEGKLAATYGKFLGDQPWWYWVTFIPQLLNNLSRSDGEANIAHQILTNLAKTYPQALHFQLRTSHEDMQVIRKAQANKESREKAAKAAKQQATEAKQEPKTEASTAKAADESNSSSRPGTSGDGDTQMTGTGEAPKEEAKKEATEENKAAETEPPKPKRPWDHTEALVTTLRTAFPLLYASMEAMVEQIQKHFKCPPDEDAYRLIVALLNDALGYIGRSPHSFVQDSKLPQQTEANITRFAESILPPHIRKAFEADFVTKKPSMFEYIQKLRKWRDKLAEKLDRRASTTFHLAETTHLSGFRFVWFDEVEVPGQYLQLKDKNQDFVRIERFLPLVDLVRGVAACHRRLKIRGHDGSIHPFAIQHPAPRHSRREERILQLFRIFNSTLSKKKESRRRNLQFHLPLMIPLSPQLRMIQDDASYVTLQGIYEDYCRRNELDKDDPIIFTMEKMRALTPQKQDQFLNTRMEALHHVQEKFVPNDIVRGYFASTFPSFDAFWLFRRQFSYQLAALTYITFTMHMTVRYPNKMSIARRNGNVWGSELIPFMSNSRPYFQNPEPVPFRLTPNLQVLMGPIHTEGIFTCALMAIARCLTSDSTYATASTANGTDGTGPATNGILAGSNCELEQHLSIFIRDEMTFWYTSSHRQSIQENELRENVQRNADAIVNKALVIAKEPEGKNLPANQSVLDLVAKATNPEKLCQTDVLWQPWL